MPKKVFISFKSEDNFKVWSLRNLAEFKNVDFEFDDVSLREAINSSNDAYIRGVIKKKLADCDICLCMIGEHTYRSRKWVPWEIETAIDLRKEVYAMRFKGLYEVLTPGVLVRNNIQPFDWDLDRLYRKIVGY